VAAHKRAEAGRGEIRLVITGAAVLRIFAITGLDRVIPHFASREEALAATSRSTESS
jgi:anti-anti-sigma regulatory factor